MKIATFTLESTAPVTFGKFHQTEKLNKELHEDYEARTWREKAHWGADGKAYIPGVMIANCIREAAKFLSIQVPGKGKATFTKHFDAGIQPKGNIVLPVTKESIKSSAVHVPSDGTRGGTKRVIRIFPIVHEWKGSLEIIIGDDTITEDIFQKVLTEAGVLIGIGTWRPRNRGANGTFRIVDFKWEDKNI